MRFQRVRCVRLHLIILVLTLTSLPAATVSAEETSSLTWQAGVARNVITPPQYMWMSGYGGRTEPANDKIHDLYVRVACLQPTKNSAPFLFISLDLVGCPVKMSTELSREFSEQYHTARENIMFACSHTHCGPALDEDLSFMLAMDEDDWDQVRKYQKFLNGSARP
jgi:hypothetical protein